MTDQAQMSNTNLLTDLNWLSENHDSTVQQIVDNTKDYIISLEGNLDRLHKMEDILDAISTSDMAGKETFLDKFKEFFNE